MRTISKKKAAANAAAGITQYTSFNPRTEPMTRTPVRDRLAFQGGPTNPNIERGGFGTSKPRSERSKRNDAKERALKARVRLEAGHKCQRCGLNGSEVHHLFTVGSHIELEFVRWNLICLCAWCHRLGANCAHDDMTAFRNWAADTFPDFAAHYIRDLDRPVPTASDVICGEDAHRDSGRGA